MPRRDLTPNWGAPIVFTKHADSRLHERTDIETLDHARDEIRLALQAQHYVHRARDIFWVYAGERTYVIASKRRGQRQVVITVLTRLEAAA